MHIQNHKKNIKNTQESNEKDSLEWPTLDYFVQNEKEFTDLRYLILSKNLVQKTDNDFVVMDNNQATISHLTKGHRYCGNIKMMPCDPVGTMAGEGFSRLIRVNGTHIFHRAMLFAEADGKTYRLRDTDGFLQLHKPQRPTIKIETF